MPTLTITTDATQAARVAHAVGQHLNLGRDATAQEIKDFVIRILRNVVQDAE